MDSSIFTLCDGAYPRRERRGITPACSAYNSPNPREVSGGICGEFAEFVVEESDCSLETMSTASVLGMPDSERPEPWHVWVTDGVKHYDAEAPNGVSAWTSLPYFQRNL